MSKTFTSNITTIFKNLKQNHMTTETISTSKQCERLVNGGRLFAHP